MRIPRRLIAAYSSLLAHEGLVGRPPRRPPRAPPGVKTLIPPFSGPPGPQEAPGSSQGVLRDHTDPYGSIRIHKNSYGPLPDQFPKNIWSFLTWSLYLIFTVAFQKNVKKCQNICCKLVWEGSVWILMDPYGPVWVRMVPEDSLGASWGLLGPWGAQKGG